MWALVQKGDTGYTQRWNRGPVPCPKCPSLGTRLGGEVIQSLKTHTGLRRPLNVNHVNGD